MTSGFKKWRDDTSTFQSQRNLVHYKSLLKPDGKKSKETLTYFNTTMPVIHITIINSAISTGIPLKGLTLSEVIIIQKEINNPKINMLRVLTRLTTNHLESCNLFGENQWGIRPYRSSDNVSLIDEVINTIHRITYKLLVKLQNDATVYYNRMF